MTLTRKTRLRATKPIAQVSAKRRAKLAEGGVTYPTTTLTPVASLARKATKPKRAKNTGPKQSVLTCSSGGPAGSASGSAAPARPPTSTTG